MAAAQEDDNPAPPSPPISQAVPSPPLFNPNAFHSLNSPPQQHADILASWSPFSLQQHMPFQSYQLSPLQQTRQLIPQQLQSLPPMMPQQHWFQMPLFQAHAMPPPLPPPVHKVPLPLVDLSAMSPHEIQEHDARVLKEQHTIQGERDRRVLQVLKLDPDVVA